jgi:hypothetical protein
MNQIIVNILVLFKWDIPAIIFHVIVKIQAYTGMQVFVVIKFLQLNYWNSESLRDMIDDTIKQPRFKIEYKNVDELYDQMENIGWSISEINVKRLIEILKKTKEGEFRKGVCLKVTYKGNDISINLEKLKEAVRILNKEKIKTNQ